MSEAQANMTRELDLTPEDRRIGDLLVRDGLITSGQLQEALAAQAEQPSARPQLGQVLIDLKLVTREQLHGVLDRHGRRRIGEILLASKAITHEQLEFALEQQKRTGQRLGDVFVKLNFTTERAMKQALCAQLGIPFVDLDNIVIDRQLVRLIDGNLARTHGVIPVAELGDVLTIAMEDPTDAVAVETLRAATGRTIEVLTSTRPAFRRAIEWLYGGETDIAVAASTRIEFLTGDTEDALADLPQVEELRQADEAVRQLVVLAMRWRASDIHLERAERGTRVRFRIDGVLQELNLGGLEETLDKQYREVMSRLRILSNMNITDRRRAQDGSFRARLPEVGEFVKINFRVSIIPGYFGESAVMRIFDPRRMPKWVQQLGFSKNLQDRLLELMARMAGMLLITGPTGCGKSTTLYTLLNTAARPEIRILTAEEPIEYVFESFTQFEVNEKIGNTYASYLKAFLHHDPEVIMLGEIRDSDTAEMALRSAQTGHLVLTTLHTADAVGAIARLTDLQVPSPLIAATLLGTLSQRLVRLVCSECAEAYRPAPEVLHEFFGDAPPEFPWRRGRGCSRCNFTGFRGRFAVGELWVPNEADRSLINRGATFEEIRHHAAASTYVMADDVRDKLAEGRTTLEELKRLLPPHSVAQFRRLGEPS